MISLEAALARVLDRVVPLAPVEVPLAEALHCVLAEDAVATEPIPPFDNTSVDGFAVRSADVATVPVELVVVGEVRAGGTSTRELRAGEAIQIMTGAPIPPGADAVVMVEDTELVPDGEDVRVRIARSAGPGDAIRPTGDDVEIGALVLRAGTVCSPAHLGVLAGLGRRSALVHRRLRVGVIATGDELVTDGSPLGPGQIRESNGELLVGLLAEANCDAVDYGVCPDEKDALGAVLRRAASECDAILTSGGVSMGEYDYVRVVLDELGEMEWMQVNIRPAKPFAIGVLAGASAPVPVFGLPGNPVSSLVSFELLARPALRKMMGQRDLERPVVRAIADAGLRRNPSDERVNFVRVRAQLGDDGRVHVASTGAQGSHQLANSAAANGLARLDAGGGVPPGGEVPVVLLGVDPGAL